MPAHCHCVNFLYHNLSVLCLVVFPILFWNIWNNYEPAIFLSWGGDFFQCLSKLPLNKIPIKIYCSCIFYSESLFLKAARSTCLAVTGWIMFLVYHQIILCFGLSLATFLILQIPNKGTHTLENAKRGGNPTNSSPHKVCYQYLN